MATATHKENTLIVWDSLTRVFHWGLAFFFVVAYFFESEGLKLHVHVGYTILLLVLFRLVWGAIGSKYSRFTNFIVSPRVSLSYLVSIWQGKSKHYIGHNPAGAVMIVTLLLMLLVTAFTGMILYSLQGSGPLANTFFQSWPGGLLSNVHDLAANISIGLIVIHIIGAVASSVVQEENLVKSMVTGKKMKQKKL